MITYCPNCTEYTTHSKGMCVKCKQFNTVPYPAEFDESEFYEANLYDSLVDEVFYSQRLEINQD